MSPAIAIAAVWLQAATSHAPPMPSPQPSHPGAAVTATYSRAIVIECDFGPSVPLDLSPTRPSHPLIRVPPHFVVSIVETVATRF